MSSGHPAARADTAPVAASRRTTALTLAIFAGLMVVLYLIRDILFPFVFAGVLAYVCTPPIDWLARRTRAPRWIFAVLALIVLMSVAALIGWLGVPPLIKEITHAGGNLQGSLEGMLRQFLGGGTIRVGL